MINRLVICTYNDYFTDTITIINGDMVLYKLNELLECYITDTNHYIVKTEDNEIKIIFRENNKKIISILINPDNVSCKFLDNLEFINVRL